MMRKDVKLGFAIGGVLLAVLVVYVLVGTGNSSDQNQGAGIVTEDTSGKVSPGAGRIAEVSPPKVGESTLPGNIGSGIGSTPTSTAANSTTGAPTTAPTDGVARNDSNKPRDANNDLWDVALNEGQLLISKTPDVTAGGASNPNQQDQVPPRATPGSGAGDEAKSTASNTGTMNSVVTAEASRTGAPSDRFRAIDRIGMSSGEPSTQPAASTDQPRANESVLGNNSGNVTSSAVPGSSSSVGGQREHVVQRYETLSSISQMAYGSPNHYPAILRANPNLDPKKMKPGMTIVLPALNEVKPELANATIAGSDGTRNASNGAATFDSKTEYRVQSNDSLYRIAMKLYGKPEMVAKLYDINKETIGPDPAKLKLNMLLKLPETPTQSAAR